MQHCYKFIMSSTNGIRLIDIQRKLKSIQVYKQAIVHEQQIKTIQHVDLHALVIRVLNPLTVERAKV